MKQSFKVNFQLFAVAYDVIVVVNERNIDYLRHSNDLHLIVNTMLRLSVSNNQKISKLPKKFNP